MRNVWKLAACVLGGAAAVIALGQAPDEHPEGDFAIVISPHGNDHTFLLERRHGNVWMLSTSNPKDVNGYHWTLTPRETWADALDKRAK